MHSMRFWLVATISIAILILPSSVEPGSSSEEVRDRFMNQAVEFLSLPVPRALAVARKDGQIVAWGVMGGAIDLQAAKKAASIACQAKVQALGVFAECVVEAVSDDGFGTQSGVADPKSRQTEMMTLKAIPKYEFLFEDQVTLYLESRGAKALSVAMEGDLVIAWGLRTDQEDQLSAENAARESCQRNVEKRGLLATCQIVAGEPPGNALGPRPGSPQVPVKTEKEPPPKRSQRIQGRSDVDSVIGLLEMPPGGSSDTVAIPGHEDIEIRGVFLSFGYRRVTVTLNFYQHSSVDKEVLYTVDIVSSDGEYFGGRTQYLYLDEGEKNTESISFGLNQKFIDSDAGGLISRVKIHSVRFH